VPPLSPSLPFHLQWFEGPDGASSWTPPFAEPEGSGGGGGGGGGAAPVLVDGRALKPGWRRCSDDEGDVWFENEEGESAWAAPFADEEEEED